MKRNDEVAGLTDQHGELEKLDPKLEEALSNFKCSVHSWSEAMVSRPRSAHEAVVRKVWKLAAGWALGGVLVAGAVSGGCSSSITSRNWPESQQRAKLNISVNLLQSGLSKKRNCWRRWTAIFRAKFRGRWSRWLH